MLDNFKTYHTWYRRLAQIMPDKCETRLTNLTLLVVGLYHAGNVHLSTIVRKWPLAAKPKVLAREVEPDTASDALSG